jgi:hypothetical protein
MLPLLALAIAGLGTALLVRRNENATAGAELSKRVQPSPRGSSLPDQHAVQAFVETAFESQRIDTPRAQATGAVLGGMIRQYLPAGSIVRALECRTSLCKVILIHPSDREDLELMTSTKGLWPGGYFVAQRRALAVGSVEVTIFAPGKGSSLPLPPLPEGSRPMTGG